MPGTLSPQERSDRNRIGAYTLHSRYDSRELTAPARAAFDARFEKEVRRQAEADGEILSDQEVARRSGHLKKAHFYRLAMKSAKARRKRAAA